MEMEEYNPDGSPQGAPKKKQRVVQLNDPRPYSMDKIKFAERFEKHQAMGIPMAMCPSCKSPGYHKLTQLNQGTSPYRKAGMACDVCGYEDTYETGF